MQHAAGAHTRTSKSGSCLCTESLSGITWKQKSEGRDRRRCSVSGVSAVVVRRRVVVAGGRRSSRERDGGRRNNDWLVGESRDAMFLTMQRSFRESFCRLLLLVHCTDHTIRLPEPRPTRWCACWQHLVANDCVRGSNRFLASWHHAGKVPTHFSASSSVRLLHGLHHSMHPAVLNTVVCLWVALEHKRLH